MSEKTAVKPSRLPKGAPASAGGRFDSNPNSQGDDSVSAQLLRAERFAKVAHAVSAGEYLAAAASPLSSDKDVSLWWDNAAQTAEHGGGYARMPEYTNEQRTRRETYAGAGVEMRMPSARAIRKFARESGNKTFDIPVSGSYPSGGAQGWLRVTQQGPAEWSVSGLGMDDTASSYLSEAASAVLESRMPSVGLSAVADLMGRRKARFAQSGDRAPEMRVTSKSGFISGAGYDSAAGILYVKMAGKKTYRYEASESVYNKVIKSASPGTIYNMLKKSAAGRSGAVNLCEKCNRYSALTATHRCPSFHNAPDATPNQNETFRAAVARRFRSAPPTVSAR